VTIDISTATSSTTTINGYLQASRVNNSSWTVVGGSVSVNAGGTLDYGTSGSPIGSGTTAYLVLAYGQSAGQYGLVVNNGGNFTVYGSTKNPYGIAVSSALATATSINMNNSDVVGWSTGDVVTIGQTELPATWANQTEQVTLTGISGSNPTTLTWSGGLSYNHIASNTIVVADLTHNVVVRSSGTNTGTNSAFLYNFVQNATSFALVYGEFAYIGDTVNGDEGIEFQGSSPSAVRGSVSSCTVRNGYYGVNLGYTSNNTISWNNIYANSARGIRWSASNMSITSNNVYAGSTGNYGIGPDDSTNAAINGNYVYSYPFDGIDVVDPNNTLTGNYSYCNNGAGILLGKWGPTGNVTLTGNVVFHNASYGISISTSAGDTLISNTVYANGSYGLYIGSSTVSVSSGAFGYNSSGQAAADTTGEVFLDSNTAASQVTFKESQVNPAPGVSTAGFTQSGSYLLSYNQDYATGTVRIWGDYKVSGSTFTLDYASTTYSGAADANKPKQLLFGASAAGFNNGRSKLEIAAGAGFHAVGQPGSPTLIDWLNSGNTYYTFVSSGAFTVQYASFTHMDESGIQLSSSGASGPWSINNSTFDYVGSRAALSTGTLFTLNGVSQSTMNVVDVTYGSHGVASPQYNYNVLGSSTGLSWTNYSYSGGLTGAALTEDDTNQAHIIWEPVGCSTFTSIASSSWSLTSTWNSGIVPTSCNPVIIAAGTTVTIDISTATSSTTTINGYLQASRVNNSSWTVVGGSVSVNAGGTLDYGTSGSPIGSGTTAYLVLAYGQSAGQYGLVVNNGGNFTVYGATKTPFSTSTTDILGSGTTFTLADNPFTIGWSTGDVITVGQTEVYNGTDQTEKKTITGIAGNVITVDSAFTQLHYASSTIDVMDLTRNVVVRSSGTSTSSNSAYIRNLVQNSTSFALTYGEFAYLGANALHKYGVAFDGLGTRGSISSSTLHDGFDGIYLNQSSNNTFAYNAIYNTVGDGGIDGNTNASANNNTLVLGNHLASNSNYGIFFNCGSNPSRNILRGNVIYAGGAAAQAEGILISDWNDILDSNVVHSLRSEGITLDACGGSGGNDTMISNRVYGIQNVGSHGGIRINDGSTGNLVVSNISYASQYGVRIMKASPNNTLIGNSFYSNSNYGVYSSSSTGNVFANNNIGYSSTSVSSPDTSAEIYFDNTATAVSNMTLKNSLVNPSPGIDTTGFNEATRYLLNYSTNTGVLQVYGDYQVSGSTLTLDYTPRLYSSTATTPTVMWGNEAASGFVVTSPNDTNAVSQLITITFDGANWNVTGSSTSGTLCSIGGGSNADCGSPVQFHLAVPAGTTAGDIANFGLIAASNDLGAPKKLLFGSSNLTNGRSKIEIAPGAGFHAIGQSATANPTLITMMSGATYYTFVDSGVFTVQYASFTYMDESGIQLSSAGVSGPWSILNSTFDYAGSGSISTSSLLTLSGVTQSTLTLVDITYGNNGVAGNKYNYNILGSSVGLSWTNQSYSGGLAGAALSEDDTNQLHIIWKPVGCSIFTSIASSSWSLTSTWNSGIVPTSCNPVTINGYLQASRVNSSSFTLVGGSMSVNSGGDPRLGHPGKPHPARHDRLPCIVQRNDGRSVRTGREQRRKLPGLRRGQDPLVHADRYSDRRLGAHRRAVHRVRHDGVERRRHRHDRHGDRRHHRPPRLEPGDDHPNAGTGPRRHLRRDSGQPQPQRGGALLGNEHVG